jgi:ComEC/Rec2-related protein
MSIFSSAKNARAWIGRTFPALSHWCRLPGLISWAAVSLGTALAYLEPFSRTIALSGARSTILRPGVWVLVAILGISGILVRNRTVRFGAFLVFAFFYCCIHRAEQVDLYQNIRPVADGAVTLTVIGKVCSAPLPYYENYHFLLRVDSIEGETALKLRGKTLNCICPSVPPLYGSVIVRGRFSLPGFRKNPFEYDEFTAQMARGIWGSFTAYSCETVATHQTIFERSGAAFRGIAVATLRKVKNFDNRALLQASFLGDTEFLSPYVKDTFRKSGIYHLIAISGLNTAMLMSALYFFLRLFPISRSVSHLLCVAALWAYLPFVGMIPSLFRATIMATMIIASLLFEKKNYPLHTLGLAGTLWLALSPESLFGPGYQLSFAATAGLFLLFPALNRFTPKSKSVFLGKIVSFLFSSFYISIASFLATALILLYHIGTVSYFGLIANLVAVTAMTFAMWAFFAGLFLQMIAPFLASVPLWVAERFLDVIVWIGGRADLFSWSRGWYPAPSPETIIVVATGLISFAAVSQERLRRYVFFTVLGMALFLPADFFIRSAASNLEMVRFAIPGVPATGIRWPGGKAWLIVADAQRFTPRILAMHIVPWLRHSGNGRIEALFVPSGSSCDTGSLRSEPGGTLTRASIRTVPVSKLSIEGPCNNCSCEIIPSDSGTGVAVRAQGVDASVEIRNGKTRTKRGSHGVAGTSGDALSAIILRSNGSELRTFMVVPADHPLRFP